MNKSVNRLVNMNLLIGATCFSLGADRNFHPFIPQEYFLLMICFSILTLVIDFLVFTFIDTSLTFDRVSVLQNSGIFF